METEPPVIDSTYSSWGDSIQEPLSARLNSRTRKRARDNRPDEEKIHENTFQKLFSAQRQPQIDIMPSYTTCQPPTLPAAPVQKSTLHSFWSLPSAPPPQRVFSATHSPGFENSDFRCDDCDRELYQSERLLGIDIASIHDEYERRKEVSELC
ncbi:V-type proton ATPase catalytic subunit A [Venturia nashicola]|uniref:V-type proton ATPase catalytic subunit A n=1 Tax=Venturia nashicola TaxID=86259 RepID=A0A4Z1PCV8_9PEZI|nr:V-type proton ATPase catalytic subunit A [Venturia nashicola]